jgi:hypothetical protein
VIARFLLKFLLDIPEGRSALLVPRQNLGILPQRLCLITPASLK